MTMRVHTSEVARIATETLTPARLDEVYEGHFDDDDVAFDVALVIEDRGNCEAMILVADDRAEVKELGLRIYAGACEQKWDNDLVQFARLIDEIQASTTLIDHDALCESMDLDPFELTDLFDRAQQVWDAAKAAV